MSVINHPEEWFFSDEAVQKYNSMTELADRAIFLYSYLKKVVAKCFKTNNTIFKTAFFLADEISGAKLTYSEYPAIISDNNPYVTFLKNSKGYIGKKPIFIIFCCILNNKVNVNDISSFIYNPEMFEDEAAYLDALEEIGCCYAANPSYFVNNPSNFETEDNLKMSQLEIYWLFGREDE